MTLVSMGAFELETTEFVSSITWSPSNELIVEYSHLDLINDLSAELYAWDQYQETLLFWGVNLWAFHDGCGDIIRGIRADQIFIDDYPPPGLDQRVHDLVVSLGEVLATDQAVAVASAVPDPVEPA